MGGTAPAKSLAAVINHPAAPATWEAIQKVAGQNAEAYSAAFKFVPKAGEASSIWPCWDDQKRQLGSHMPFNEQFWRGAEVRDEHFTWDAQSRGREAAPVGVEGYIVALPLQWTKAENNLSGINLSLIAATDTSSDDRYANEGGFSADHIQTAIDAEILRGTDKSTHKGTT